MKFVIAPDSFKNCLSAQEVATAVRDGLARIFPEAEYTLVPMADGGEGTVQSLVDATNGHLIHRNVTGPLGTPVDAYYGILGDGTTAVIEMAQASGFQYVPAEQRNPLVTTTYGTGELILDALDHQVKKIILGIGGSATNDGGAGMAQAIGVRLLDAAGNEFPGGGGALNNLRHIDMSHVDPRIATTEILVASDVAVPLVGPKGASAVFGPQKGATPEMVKLLDANLKHYAEVIKQDLDKDVADIPGSGAAGGLGAGLMAFTKAKMCKGIDLVVQFSHLKQKAQDADFVFTGEGSVDEQTQYGKTPYGVAKATKEVAPNAPVIVLAGRIGSDVSDLYAKDGVDAIFSAAIDNKPFDIAMKESKHDIALSAENIARLLKSIYQDKHINK